MNQGKLEVAKQEMTRVNIYILGISKLKWTGKGEFNSDDYYIYYCGQESLRRKEVALTVNKRVWKAVLGCSLKNNRMISVHFQGKPFSITIIQVYAPTSNAEKAEVEWFYEDLLELTPTKYVLLHSSPLWWKGHLGSSAGKESASNAGDPSLIPGSGSSPREGIGYPLQYSCASLVAQTVKNPPAMWETWVQSLGWEDPLEEGMATHSSILAWRIPMDRGAWWAIVHGVSKCWTRQSD